MPHKPPLQSIRVWDLPTRLFHALLALCVVGLVVTGEIGEDALQIHFWFGYTVLSLILFRFVWGWVGGHWSRFVHFVPTPSALRAYIQATRNQQATDSVGHNPLGALSVLAMLFILLIQVLSGFLSDDEIATTGPWTSLVSNEWVSLATEYHSEIGKVLLIVLVVVHVAAVVYYKYVKHTDLIHPMIHGDKTLPSDTQPSRDTRTSRLFALSIFFGCVYVVYRLVNLA
jgi:cytochrome b